MKEKRKTLHFAFGKVKKVAILVAAFILSANCNIAFAQNLGESQQVHGLDDLYGKDPSSDICTSNSYNETSPDKILYLYNVGAKKFLSIGGYWGTHASLNSSPHRLYIKQSGSSYNVESKVGGGQEQAPLWQSKMDMFTWTDQLPTLALKREMVIQKPTRFIL